MNIKQTFGSPAGDFPISCPQVFTPLTKEGYFKIKTELARSPSDKGR
jgi:hypothetical protein